MADLDGRRLAVELGAQGHVEATQWAKRLRELTILPYPSADDALASVAAGQADAAVVDGVSGRLYLKNHPNASLERVQEPITVEPYALVVRNEDETLLAKLDEALVTLADAGELDHIIRRWLGA
jgi:polar amino acid transport system substrate-binding protein